MFSNMFNRNIDINEEKYCKECGLYKGCKTPKMDVTGQGLKKCLILAEAPGKTEDEQGTQLIGSAGQLLRKKLIKYNFDINRDFWKLNVINCRPPGNRKPKKNELKACWFKVKNAIDKLKPQYIWLIGGAAIESFLLNLYPGRFSNTSVGLWRGHCIPDQKLNAWIFPLYHPSALLHNPDKGLENTFDKDLENAVNCLNKESVKIENFNKQIDILIDYNLIISKLKQIKNSNIIAFDYETTGIKPYQKGHKVWCISISNGKTTFAFPYEYPGIFTNIQKEEIKKLWIDILKDNNIRKCAQNLSYEEEWSRIIFGTPVSNWYHDTMLFNHIFDSRGSNTGLKFQAYIRYGVDDYANSVNKYMNEGTDGLNKLNKLPLDKLLQYCALDSLFTFMMQKDQLNELKSIRNIDYRNSLQNIYNIFHKGILTFADMQEIGIEVDLVYYKQQEILLDREINELMNALNNCLEAKRFERFTGEKINWDSSKDLRILFYDILKLPCYKTTTAGNGSVDAEVLNVLESEIDIVKKLLEYRKLFKAKNTYLAQFSRYEINGKLHPSFHLHIARTGRSASSSPNMQNQPIRDDKIKKIIRGGIIPSKGNRLIEIDYGALEARGIAIASKDPELIKDINDPHSYWAKEVFIISESQKTKDIRFYTKNQFVFPLFYGSWYKSCATNLWKNCIDLKTGDGATIRNHFKNIGIYNFEDFEKHIQRSEEKFWNKFKVVKEWQNGLIEKYHKTGYVDSFFGFKRTGYLSRNEIINSPIQGGCFHILLSCLIKLNEIRKQENWKTKIICQIHDSIIFDVNPDEFDHVIKTANYIMTDWIRKQNPWIIVPLLVEFEATEIDQSWYYKKEIKI